MTIGHGGGHFRTSVLDFATSTGAFDDGLRVESLGLRCVHFRKIVLTANPVEEMSWRVVFFCGSLPTLRWPHTAAVN
jgi:hypothetical protein